VFSGLWVALGWLVCGAGGAMGGELEPSLHVALGAGSERFGLVTSETLSPAAHLDGEPGAAVETKEPPTPIAAGCLSALVPGAGQLLQGDRRGWVYLGVEVAAWFSYFAVHGAANQAQGDYHEYADANWSLARYDSVGSCGPGLGPVDYPEERAALEDAYQNSRDQYYQDIGEDDVYACGWGTQAQRADYQSMISDADNLYTAAEYIVGGIVLNHIVSAIDAAKSASGKRKTAQQSFRWEVSPVAPGALGLRVQVSQDF
jgi:hypothetical protein